MRALPLFLAILTALLMATGQILFKLGAAHWNGAKLNEWIASFITNPYLIVAMCMYIATTVMWIYVLRTLPLSLAYPLTALSYVVVPILSYVFLQEKIELQTIVGSLVIISGIVIINLQ